MSRNQKKGRARPQGGGKGYETLEEELRNKWRADQASSRNTSNSSRDSGSHSQWRTPLNEQARGA
jgi:hypothetical protein